MIASLISPDKKRNAKISKVKTIIHPNADISSPKKGT
jgi:hypothetical protein